MTKLGPESLKTNYQIYQEYSQRLETTVVQLQSAPLEDKAMRLCGILSDYLASAYTTAGMAFAEGMGMLRRLRKEEVEEIIDSPRGSFYYKDRYLESLDSIWLRTGKNPPSGFPWQVDFIFSGPYGFKLSHEEGTIVPAPDSIPGTYPIISLTRDGADLGEERRRIMLGISNSGLPFFRCEGPGMEREWEVISWTWEIPSKKGKPEVTPYSVAQEVQSKRMIAIPTFFAESYREIAGAAVEIQTTLSPVIDEIYQAALKVN